MEIPIYYDPMIGKLVTYGEDRNAAIQLMIEAIDAFKLEGVKTTLPFGKWVMQHPEFISGNLSTNFIKDYFKPELLEAKLTDEEQLIAAVMAAKVFHQT